MQIGITNTFSDKMKRSPIRAVAFVVRWLLLHFLTVVLGVVFALPLIWMLSSSLKSSNMIFQVPPQWIPKSIPVEQLPGCFAVYPVLQILAQHVDYRPSRDDGRGGIRGIGGIWIFSCALAWQERPFRLPDRHHDPALFGDNDPGFHRLQKPGLGRHFPTLDHPTLFGQRI